MVLYPNKLPESERVCSGICKINHNLLLAYGKKSLVDYEQTMMVHALLQQRVMSAHSNH